MLRMEFEEVEVTRTDEAGAWYDHRWSGCGGDLHIVTDSFSGEVAAAVFGTSTRLSRRQVRVWRQVKIDFVEGVGHGRVR